MKRNKTEINMIENFKTNNKTILITTACLKTVKYVALKIP
jgi:hypothetical protein